MTFNGSENSLVALIHISDLHFGESFPNEAGFFTQVASNLPGVGGLLPHSYQAARALSARIKQICRSFSERDVPLCVVFTGDLTKSGKEAEFLTGNTFLRSAHSLGAGNYVGLELKDGGTPVSGEADRALLFAIPGNHDIWSRSDSKVLGIYRQTFPGNYPLFLEMHSRGPAVHIHGVDSTVNTPIGHKFARGRVAPEDLEIVEDRVRTGAGQKALQIVCIHHPLSDPPDKTFDLTMRLEQREMVCMRLYEARANLVLSGHVHEWFISQEGICGMPNQFTVGTGTQQRSKRSFAVMEVFESNIRIYVFEFDEIRKQFVPTNTPFELPISAGKRAALH